MHSTQYSYRFLSLTSLFRVPSNLLRTSGTSKTTFLLRQRCRTPTTTLQSTRTTRKTLPQRPSLLRLSSRFLISPVSKEPHLQPAPAHKLCMFYSPPVEDRALSKPISTIVKTLVSPPPIRSRALNFHCCRTNEGDPVYLDKAQEYLESLLSPPYFEPDATDGWEAIIRRSTSAWGDPSTGSVTGDYFTLETLASGVVFVSGGSRTLGVGRHAGCSREDMRRRAGAEAAQRTHNWRFFSLSMLFAW